jgi:hypothetical protein
MSEYGRLSYFVLLCMFLCLIYIPAVAIYIADISSKSQIGSHIDARNLL